MNIPKISEKRTLHRKEESSNETNASYPIQMNRQSVKTQIKWNQYLFLKKPKMKPSLSK